MASQIPQKAIDAQGADISLPLQTLLRSISVLPNENDKQDAWSGAFTGPPQSVAVLEAGATAFAKGWTLLVGAVGGGTALTAVLNKFWLAQSDALHVVIAAGASLVVVAAFLSIAGMVSADLRWRTTGALAVYEVRKEVALNFVDKSFNASIGGVGEAGVVVGLATAKAAAYVEHIPTGDLGHLCGLRITGTGVEVQWNRISDNTRDWCAPTDLKLREFGYPVS